MALLDISQASSSAVEDALEYALETSSLIISAPVYAELMAFPNRSARALDTFLSETEIGADWEVDEPTWRLAGSAYQVFQSVGASMR